MASMSINPDHFLETDGGRIWTPERSVEAWRLAFESLHVSLLNRSGEMCRVVVVCGLQGAGKSTWVEEQGADPAAVYFDAALPGARHRKPIIDIARSHGAAVVAVWIRVPLAVALERNARRSPDKIVPDLTIRSVATNFEPPSTEEGFETVTIIEG